jgi:hypothetical protein
MNSPDGAFFVVPLKAEQSGVDFLGLAAVGEGLVATLLPGISNVTRYLRPYFYASWIAWRFEEYLKEHDGKRLPGQPKTLFRKFREKTELAFTWGNQELPGVIGKRREFPEKNSVIELQFANPELGASNAASWFAAATYGPSFTKLNGLGFIESRAGVYRPTELGAEAAALLDREMQKAGSSYRRLADVESAYMRRSDIEALEGGLALDRLLPRERAVFARVLLPEDLIGTLDGGHGNRASTLEAIRRVLEAGGAMSVPEVRRALATGRTGPGELVDFAPLEEVRRRWFTLSVRQLQRIALERLLRWFEHCIFSRIGRSSSLGDLLNDAESDLRRHLHDAASESVATHLDRTASVFAKHGGPEEAGWNDPRFDVLARAEGLVEDRDVYESLPARAMAALLLCAAVVEATRADKALAKLFAYGGQGRWSLTSLREFTFSRRNLSIGQFLREALVVMVYAQHLQTASRRTEPDKNKFRFTPEDHGLALLVNGLSINAQEGTPDRLWNCLELMTEAGLVRKETDGRYAI